jgi:hypothetical protein
MGSRKLQKRKRGEESTADHVAENENRPASGEFSPQTGLPCNPALKESVS